MTFDQKEELRLWPGVVSVVLMWLVTFGSGKVAPATAIQFFGMMGGPVGGLLLVVLWWAFASRAPKRDRVLGVVAILVFLGAAFALAHSTAQIGVYVYGLPTVCTAFVAWAWLCRRWADGPRLAALVATLAVACGAWTLVRTKGVDGDMAVQFAPRWQATAEERLLAEQDEVVPVAASPDVADMTEMADMAEADVPVAAWPGFRGADRCGVASEARVATDWQASPPEELWRRPVGPGWSSFAVAGERLYTQEQRGDDEVVSAYDAATGEPLWRHSDPARFWEALAGAGPRATPTYDGGRLYSFGATGILNALDAAEGTLLWSHDVAADTGAPTPDWGFSSSPLVSEGVVVVHTGGPDGKAVAAYDAVTGEPRWFAAAGALSYSSVQQVRLAGVDQLIVLTGDGAHSLSPADGSLLWFHEWPMPGGARITQTQVTPGDGILVGTGFGMGLRRVAVTRDGDAWQARETWTSKELKPYYNDFVVHEGHVYGFDGRILACLDLETGERRWKGGRYGNGQLLLLPAQDLLLVLSDRGEIALVEAKPDGFSELAKTQAIEGKTWNHPVLAEGVLYVRNAEEMAAFRMPS